MPSFIPVGTPTPGAGDLGDQAAWSIIGPSWLLSTGLHVLPYATFLALQAIMNAAVTSISVGSIIGVRSDVNRTLQAQGVANIVCGALAALPISTSASLSLPAARMKGATGCQIIASGTRKLSASGTTTVLAAPSTRAGTDRPRAYASRSQ